MRRNLLPFLAKLAVVSAVFGYIWFVWLQRAYPDIIDPVARPFLTLLGVRKWWLALTAEHFTNIVPYVALVLATPGLTTRWKRGLIALLGGLAVLMLGHLLMSTAVYYVVDAYSMGKQAYRLLVPVYLVNDALPLVLWLAFFPTVLSELFGFVKWGRG